MYQVLGLRNVLSGVTIVALVIFGLWLLIAPPESPWEVTRALWGSASATVFVVLLLGQTTCFIPWLARKPMFNRVLPDLDGLWRAELTSNWPVIARAHGLEPPSAATPISASVCITVRLLTVRLELQSDSRYSESDTVAVRVLKNQEHGDISLHYIYKNETPVAESTDSGIHYGAASLKLKGKGSEPRRLEGHYWTNRNWEKGLNTAGRIILTRLASKCA